MRNLLWENRKESAVQQDRIVTGGGVSEKVLLVG